MEDARYLIIGAQGQLGKALQARYPHARAVDRDELDITDLAAMAAYDWSAIDIILNAAAYTNVDGAETAEGRQLAWKINATAVGCLARIAYDNNLLLLHVSTDYVFDGTQAEHKESESLAPLGVYGQSKAAGDIAVAVCPKHYILRTSWVIGDGPNFVRTMMDLAAKNISPKVVDDQIGRPTFTAMLVEAIDRLLSTSAEFGTYNLSNSGEPASWADITRAIFKQLGRDDLKVTGISTAEYFKDKPAAAPRPLQSSLDLTKIAAIGLELHDWRSALHDYIVHEQAA